MQHPTLTLYLRHLRNRGLRPSTIRTYRTALADYLATIHPTEPQDAQPLHVERWDLTMIHQELTPTTRANRLSILRTYYRYLVTYGRAPSNPAANHPSPRIDRTLPTIADPNTVHAMLASCDLETPKGLRNAALVAILFHTGARPSEIAAIDRDHIEADWPHVWVHLAPGKGRRHRRLPLHPTAAAYYRQWNNARTDNLAAAFLGFRTYRAGTPLQRISTRAIHLIVTELSDQAGHCIPPKVARSTVATHFTTKGLDPWTISEWLGHANISTIDAYRKRLGTHFLRALHHLPSTGAAHVADVALAQSRSPHPLFPPGRPGMPPHLPRP